MTKAAAAYFRDYSTAAVLTEQGYEDFLARHAPRPEEMRLPLRCSREAEDAHPQALSIFGNGGHLRAAKPDGGDGPIPPPSDGWDAEGWDNTQENAAHRPTRHVVALASVRPERVSWTWQRYIPAGKVTVGEGW